MPLPRIIDIIHVKKKNRRKKSFCTSVTDWQLAESASLIQNFHRIIVTLVIEKRNYGRRERQLINIKFWNNRPALPCTPPPRGDKGHGLIEL